MRENISDVATRLFTERGFDHVTVEEIATAADVGRMTVFNHFPRKEDMFFDRDDEIRETLREVLRQPDPLGTPVDQTRAIDPMEAYRLLAHRLVERESPYVEFSAASQGFVKTIEDSETLKARARALRDELAQVLSAALSEYAARQSAARTAEQTVAHPNAQAVDPSAQLAAGLLVTTWTVAVIQAHRVFRQTGDTDQATAAFLALIDQGSVGLKAAMAGTAYA